MKGYSLYCLIYAIQNSHYLWRRDAHSNLSISMKIFRKLGVRLILIPRSTLVPGGQTVPFKRSSCSEVLLVHSYSYDHCFFVAGLNFKRKQRLHRQRSACSAQTQETRPQATIVFFLEPRVESPFLASVQGMQQFCLGGVFQGTLFPRSSPLSMPSSMLCRRQAAMSSSGRWFVLPQCLVLRRSGARGTPELVLN